MQDPDEPAPNITQVLALVRIGDESAARQLVNLLYPQVIRIVRSHLPNNVQEEDLAQEIFIKMFTRISQFKGEVPFEHWVSRIAINTCRDSLRYKQKRPELRWADLSQEQADWLSNTESRAAELSPDMEIAAKDLLNRILETLSPEDQIIVRLLYVEEKSVNEIAQITGWNKSLIKIRAFRAKAKLRKAWAKLKQIGI